MRKPLAGNPNELANYELTEAAVDDLKGIVLYTISKWGSGQAARYGAFLDAHFEAIGVVKQGPACSSVTDQSCVSHAPDIATYSIWSGKSSVRLSWPCSTNTWIS